MNEHDRAELVRLKVRQARMEQDLSQLSSELKLLEQRLDRPEAESHPAAMAKTPDLAPPSAPRVSNLTMVPIAPAPPAVPSHPLPASAVPPIIRASQTVPGQQRVPAAESVRREAASMPHSMVTPAAASKTLGSKPIVPGPGQTAPSVAGTRPPEPAPSNPPRSFEMQLGTYWLVRVGIVMVLTGLVFFGNLAYHNYISRLGPAGKLALLYVASGLLLGAGWWWQRQAVKGSLRNYAQVLFAGGWAALYFTTYAAHHVEVLRVIQSARLDGVLLLVCAGWMVWVSDRKKSEVMALFAVGLAYYTCIITRVGYFTLYSNLLLAVAAVSFLVRNRWAVLSFGSLVATYSAYGFWRFYNGQTWQWASPEEGLWSGTYFLIAYWVVFTAAVFLSRAQEFAGEKRATFLTLNNGAFFSMFLLTMLQVREGGFWRFALIYGVALLGLAEGARRVLAAEPLAANSYLTQGLLLVTVGFISKFAGLQLALILAAESVVLLLMSYRRGSMILRAGAYLAAGLAVGWGVDGMRLNDASGLWLAMGLGALMLVNGMIAHRRTLSDTEFLLRPQPSYFIVLAMASWLVATWNNTARENFPLVMAGEAVLLTLSIYLLSVREITLFAQLYMVLAQMAWVGTWFASVETQPWWKPALMVGLSLGLSHWWQKQRILGAKVDMGRYWEIVYGLAIVVCLHCWLSPRTQPPGWLVLSAGLGLVLTAYGVLTRAWYLAACGQIFVAVGALQFGIQLAQSKPEWAFALAPIAVLAVLSGAALEWFRRHTNADSRVREPVLQLALIYRWVALLMSIAWVCEYIPDRERIWVLTLTGLGIFLWAGQRRNREGLLFSAPFTITALVLFWVPLLEAPTVYWADLVAIVVILAQREIARRMPDRYPLRPEWQAAVIIVGGLSLWLFVSRWVLEQASGFYLTASWSLLALALFSCGIVLRERVYRWVGLGLLACAVGRVLIFDVWKLEPLYRILSFMALGIVLLVLGFIYNKYQEKIKEWL